jgi:hypothetical protein
MQKVSHFSYVKWRLILFCLRSVVQIHVRFLHLSRTNLFDSPTSVDAPPPYPDYKGCFIEIGSKMLSGNYATLTAIEASKCYWPLRYYSKLTYFAVFLTLITIGTLRSCSSAPYFHCCKIAYPSLQIPDREGNIGKLSLIIHRDGERRFILSW